MHRGFVKLWRKALDSELLRHPSAWQFLCWCLLKATYHKQKQIVGGTTIDLEPGQLVTGRYAAARELGTTDRKIRSSLNLLQKMGFLTIETTNRFTLISIVNWSSYQNVDVRSGQQNDQQMSNKRPTNDHDLKKEKKDQEEEAALAAFKMLAAKNEAHFQ